MRTAVGIAALALTVTGFVYVVTVLNLHKVTGEYHWNLFDTPSELTRLMAAYAGVAFGLWLVRRVAARWRS